MLRLLLCLPSQEACSFNGAWRGKPSSMARVYYVSSYFWDRALDSGIIADKQATSWKTSPGVSRFGWWGVRAEHVNCPHSRLEEEGSRVGW